jgi:hypothetical protein
VLIRYVVLNGVLVATTALDGESEAKDGRVRHIANGGSVNVLHLLGVWNHCVETVEAKAVSVET